MSDIAQRFFVTGTDTGVGKTLVAASLLHSLSSQGKSCLGLKPVAAGSSKTEAGWRNDDALLLQQYSLPSAPYESINPIALQAPLAPHIAAEREGVNLLADTIVAHCQGLLLEGERRLCLVEGAGGWRVPLSGRESFADLAKMLGLPVILVVGIRLGCINHALLTAEAIRADGLMLAAWVGNLLDPDMAAQRENIDTLAAQLGAPCLGYIPHLASPRPEVAATYLDMNKLLDTSCYYTK